jgi:hypothetical protein
MLDLELGAASHVRGVLAVIVVTAGTAEYKPIIEAQARKCREFGYEHRIYDLGGLGIGTPYEVPESDLRPTVNGDSLPPATFKAALVDEALHTAQPGETVCWLDADCLPVLPFEPSATRSPKGLELMLWDAAVTLRPAPEIGLSNNPALDYLNSGVVWIRNTLAGKRFCEDWQRMSVRMKTDQGALNEAVWSYKLKRAPEDRGKIIQALATGARVLILDAMEWNCWHFPPPPEARILHFKGGIRYLAKDYVNR